MYRLILVNKSQLSVSSRDSVVTTNEPHVFPLTVLKLIARSPNRYIIEDDASCMIRLLIVADRFVFHEVGIKGYQEELKNKRIRISVKL